LYDRALAAVAAEVPVALHYSGQTGQVNEALENPAIRSHPRWDFDAEQAENLGEDRERQLAQSKPCTAQCFVRF